MGIYIYALQPPATVRKVQFKGQKVRLGVIQFAYKPSGRDDEFNREMNKHFVQPMRRAWAGKERPRFVLRGETEVYTWPRGWVACSDDDNFGVTVKKVGELVGDTIVPCETEVTS